MLAVNLDQEVPDLRQERRADRLVIEKGTRGAVAADHAFHGQGLVRRSVNACFGQCRPDWMADRGRKLNRHTRLVLPRPDHPTVGPVPHRKRQGIENDGLARPGLPGQRRKPGARFDVQAVNQDEITYRQ